MTGNEIGFLIWCLAGCLFIGLGIHARFAKAAVGFWANAQMFEVTDRQKYNAAMSKLFCAFGIVFSFLGLPLLSGSNSAWILFSVFGALAECIAAMAIYTLVIEKKYKKK